MTPFDSDIHFADIQRDALHPANWAIEALRARGAEMLPLYTLAMLPFSLAMLNMINTITAGDRPKLLSGSLLLALAFLWRWAVLARLQREVLIATGAQPKAGFWARLPAILAIRMVCLIVATYGIFVFGVPTLYALVAAGCVAPALLDEKGPAGATFRAAMPGASAALRLAVGLVVLGAAIWIALDLAQAFLFAEIMPSFFHVRDMGLSITIQSAPWQLSFMYLCWLPLDMVWTLAGVRLYRLLRAGHGGTDLFVRMRMIGGTV